MHLHMHYFAFKRVNFHAAGKKITGAKIQVCQTLIKSFREQQFFSQRLEMRILILSLLAACAWQILGSEASVIKAGKKCPRALSYDCLESAIKYQAVASSYVSNLSRQYSRFMFHMKIKYILFIAQDKDNDQKF